MRNVKAIVILYPGETSSERINKPANYSFSRLLLRLHAENRIPIYFLNQSARYERYGNIRFIHFTKPNFVRILAANGLRRRTLIISIMHVYRKYARLLRRVLPDSRMLVRLGGVYHGRSYFDTPAFAAHLESHLTYLRTSADMVLSTADGTPVDYFMERVGVPPERYRKWLNGFPEIPNVGGFVRTNRILSIARLSGEKGIDYVIRSYAAALPSLRAPHTLTIVGDGPERENLKALARSLGVDGSVDFVGDSYDVARYFYSSKLLLSGLANNPILEAIATGTPVVAVELGETRRLYGGYPNVHVVDYPPGGCGRIDPAHRESLVRDTAAKMVEVLNQGPATSGAPKELFSWEARLDAELQLYESLFDRNGRAN
jgi:glycosyltransferase involved in cell wall biosynthesis